MQNANLRKRKITTNRIMMYAYAFKNKRMAN